MNEQIRSRVFRPRYVVVVHFLRFYPSRFSAKFFTILEFIEIGRICGGNEMPGNRCLVSCRAKKREAKLWTVCEGGKKISKKCTGPCAIFESKKLDAPLLSPRPAKNEGEKSFERTEADIDYYTPSRIEMCLELFAHSRAFKKTVLRDFIGIFDKASPGWKIKSNSILVNEIQFLVERS